jgi:hypothetical protein
VEFFLSARFKDLFSHAHQPPRSTERERERERERGKKKVMTECASRRKSAREKERAR